MMGRALVFACVPARRHRKRWRALMTVLMLCKLKIHAIFPPIRPGCLCFVQPSDYRIIEDHMTGEGLNALPGIG